METKEKKELRTRYDEIRLRTLDPEIMLGKYLVEPAKRAYKEDFVDESTGEIATVERTEIIEEAGTLVTKDVLARFQFFIQAGELKEVLVSNQNRCGARSNYNIPVPYTVTLKPFEAPAVKLLVRANSLPMAIQIAEDYGDYIIPGRYRTKSAKREDDFIIIDEPLKEKDEKGNEKPEPSTYYKIDALITVVDKDGKELLTKSPHTILLPSADADVARKHILRQIATEYKKEHGVVSVELTLSEARVFNASDIVPWHFSLKYSDMAKTEEMIMNGNRVGVHPA